jgi:hypothetical protein
MVEMQSKDTTDRYNSVVMGSGDIFISNKALLLRWKACVSCFDHGGAEAKRVIAGSSLSLIHIAKR